MDNDRIKKLISERLEASLFSAFGQTTANPTDPGPLTLDTLRRMMASMPPRETWLSSKLFPSDRAIIIKGAGENFTCAGAGFWLRMESELRRTSVLADPTMNGLGMNMSPIEIDEWPGDSEETAKWRAAHWTRLREAALVAMTELPEWLRSPPKFGKHG